MKYGNRMGMSEPLPIYDEDRFRAAQERRERRAQRKAENVRRATAGRIAATLALTKP